MLNLFIFVIVQTQRGTGIMLIIPPELIKFNSESFECREDEVAMLFM